jgi:guanine deaminase
MTDIEMSVDSKLLYMDLAVEQADESVRVGGGPFGAVIVDRNNIIIAKAHNEVVLNCDPTAHAEIQCIRYACSKMRTHDLTGCTLYSSCEPCSMCLSAIYWARIDKIYYGNTREDAKDIGFDDSFIYDEIAKPVEQRSKLMLQCGRHKTLTSFETWKSKLDKIHY